MDSSGRCRISATTSVGRSARAVSTAITSLVLGTVGSSIAGPWQRWTFHRASGGGGPGFGEDRGPAFPVKVESGRVLVNVAAPSRRTKAPHKPHPLSRQPERAPGPPRLAGISTTIMDMANPRFSGSDHLLDCAPKSAAEFGAEPRLILRTDQQFRAC